MIPISQYQVGSTLLISHNEVFFTRPVERCGQGVQCIRAPFSRGISKIIKNIVKVKQGSFLPTEISKFKRTKKGTDTQSLNDFYWYWARVYKYLVRSVNWSVNPKAIRHFSPRMIGWIEYKITIAIKNKRPWIIHCLKTLDDFPKLKSRKKLRNFLYWVYYFFIKMFGKG